MPDGAGRLLFVGQAALDHVFRVDRFASAGSKNIASGYECRAGGMAANAARGARRLRDESTGPQILLVSAVGDDAAGDELCRALDDEGLDTSAVTRVPGARSTVSAVLVDAAGERQVHNFRGDALQRAGSASAGLLEGFFGGSSDGLFNDCVGVLADPRWPDAAALAFAEARRSGVPSVLDADIAATSTLRSLAPQASWCVFSRGGLDAWAGAERVDPGDGMASVAASLPASAADVELVVTLGADGALWRRPDGSQTLLSAFRVDVLDSTGAGDVLHGALLLGLAERRAPHEALRRAMAAAALACRGSLPSRRELDTFLETHR